MESQRFSSGAGHTVEFLFAAAAAQYIRMVLSMICEVSVVAQARTIHQVSYWNRALQEPNTTIPGLYSDCQNPGMARELGAEYW